MLRRPCRVVACTAAVAAAATAARAQDHPFREVGVGVPFPAGGRTDAVARPLASAMGGRIPQPIAVENAAVAGTMRASRFAKVAADRAGTDA